MTLGKHSNAPLVLARERHAEARKLFATGVDPMAKRIAEKASPRMPYKTPLISGRSTGRREKLAPRCLREAPHGDRHSVLLYAAHSCD